MQIRDSKPLGARLDEARAALARAQARRAEAAKALELAQAAIVASDTEIASFTANVEELEKSIASAGDMAADVAMDSASDPKDVLASIGTQLQTLRCRPTPRRPGSTWLRSSRASSRPSTLLELPATLPCHGATRASNLHRMLSPTSSLRPHGSAAVHKRNACQAVHSLRPSLHCRPEERGQGKN